MKTTFFRYLKWPHMCAEEDITEVKEWSGGGGHWGDKETKVDKLKYRSSLSLSCVFFFNESTDSCFFIVANYIFYWLLLVHVWFKITLEVYCRTLEVFYHTLNCVLQYLIKMYFYMYIIQQIFLIVLQNTPKSNRLH